MQFWKKAERVVTYKQQTQVEARKKEAMDKHLTFLVGQTQKYSSLLAQRLADSSAQDGDSAPQSQALLAAAVSTGLSQGPSSVAPSHGAPQRGVRTGESAQHALAVKSEKADAHHEGPTVAGLPTQSDARQAGTATASPGSQQRVSEGNIGLGSAFSDADLMDDEEDFQAGSASEAEDDEVTLEEEEVGYNTHVA
jgi:hypothetical protein